MVRDYAPTWLRSGLNIWFGRIPCLACKGSRHAMALIFSLTRLGGREARRRSVLAIGVQKADAIACKKPYTELRSAEVKIRPV
jgi:hypothetical protein